MTTAYKATPTSRDSIADYTRRIRKKIGLENQSYFPIVEFLEMMLQDWFPDMTLEIVDPDKMPFKEGETIPGQNKILIREDVYLAACEGDGRARFTLAHEVGHFLLHTPDSISLCRLEEGTKLRAFEDPEWQANTFASELLAPGYLINGLTKSQVMNRCGLSEKAAKVALAKCKR